MKVGTAFHTNILIHHSCLWVLLVAVVALVFRNVASSVEAIIVGMLVFGSVLLATLARVFVARRSGVVWSAVLLFPVGAVARRERCSTLRQERVIASAEFVTYALLALLLSQLSPDLFGIAALFNLGMLPFALLLRLSPNHENLLHAILAQAVSKNAARHVMTTLNTLFVTVFLLAGIALIVVGWWAFGLWFVVALMGSQLIESAEVMGEYRDEITEEAVVTIVNRSSAPPTLN